MSTTGQMREAQIGEELNQLAAQLKKAGDLTPEAERGIKERLLALADELGQEKPDEPDKPPEPPKPQPGGVPSFSAKHLAAILPNLDDVDANFAALEKAALEFKLTSFDRLAQFLGQVGHETGGGQWFQELDNASGTYLRSKPYYPYFGRGAIHLTWRENYQLCADFFGNQQIVSKPAIVSSVGWRWRTAMWFWTNHGGNLNLAADRVDFEKIMATVLGTSDHPSYDERWRSYIRACQNLPIPFALAGAYRRNIDRALAYILPARGKVEYEWWTHGPLRDGSPAWSANAAPPPIGKYQRGFCASVPNLMLRKVGKRVPFRTNLGRGVDPREWDGGIAAYFGGVFGGAYFENYMRPIQNPDADRPHGTLLGSPFYGSANQGHVGVVLGNGRFLDLNSVDDFQSKYWTSYAIKRFKLKLYVLPNGWLEYEGDEFL